MNNQILRTACVLALLAAVSTPAMAQMQRGSPATGVKITVPDFIITVPVKITDLAPHWDASVDCRVFNSGGGMIAISRHELIAADAANRNFVQTNPGVVLSFKANPGEDYTKAASYTCNFFFVAPSGSAQQVPPNTNHWLTTSGPFQP